MASLADCSLPCWAAVKRTVGLDRSRSAGLADGFWARTARKMSRAPYPSPGRERPTVETRSSGVRAARTLRKDATASFWV